MTTDRLHKALEDIVSLEPCVSEDGVCFYPMLDDEGNHYGEQTTDPLAVIQQMVKTAQDALMDDFEETFKEDK